MKEIIKLSNTAYNYLDSGKIEDAEGILTELKKKTITPELKFTMSALLIDLGVESKKMNYIDEGINNFKELKQETNFNVDYNLANGYYAKYRIISEKPNYLTKKDHLLTLAKQLYVNAINKTPIEQLPLLYINLGNTYDYIGRTIDALEYYERVPKHPYSLLNKGIGLYEYSKFTNNYLSILKDAYRCFESVLKIQNIPLEFESICNEYMETIEEICGYDILKDESNKKLTRPTEKNFENFIINFCLENKLYLNLCNFCQRCDNAIGDTLIIPNMIVKISETIENNSYLKLSSQLNQIKMDYVSSRFLLILSQYEEINLDLINKNIILINTLSYEDYDIKVQLLKNSFTNFYNILDKIAHLINLYFNLNKKSDKLNFHNVWNNQKSNINGNLSSLTNKGLSALYDIHLELEHDHEKYYLRKMRNDITHNFLQVKLFKMEKYDTTINELKHRTIEIAKIVKNAIIYLIRAIDINEKYKKEKYKNIIIPEIETTIEKL